MKILRLILGDQLNQNHSWFKKTDPDITYILIEAKSESEYVTHHIQKIVCFFSAMRNFASLLKSQGHLVKYIKINDIENKQDIIEQLKYEISKTDYALFEHQEPDEYRLDSQLKRFTSSISIPSNVVSSEHFLSERLEVQQLFSGKKTYLMETFYRKKRKDFNLLMFNNKPLGETWNYDDQNRKAFSNQKPVPEINDFNTDVSEVLHDIESSNLFYFGKIDSKSFQWPINRAQALQQLNHFCTYQLPFFGTYEDAMHSSYPILYHSRISQALNMKLIHPLEVIFAVLIEWKKRAIEKDLADKVEIPPQFEFLNHWKPANSIHLDQLLLSESLISINQVEGFIRQIMGWREFMRGVYWSQMPEFSSMNFFNHTRKLPNWFWNGNTKMNCLHHVINQSLSMSWAHHIQRLMITGNFALLSGIHPNDVDLWYLGIYIDAIEWVEITNTRGMSQFADGGLIATKPYVSSANYIHKMSNYCSECFYTSTEKVGNKACPFNSLYWHFFERNRLKLEKNPRIGMMYKTWDKMDPNKKVEILNQAENYLADIENL